MDDKEPMLRNISDLEAAERLRVALATRMPRMEAMTLAEACGRLQYLGTRCLEGKAPAMADPRDGQAIHRVAIALMDALTVERMLMLAPGPEG
jgi:hypothetical protein